MADRSRGNSVSYAVLLSGRTSHLVVVRRAAVCRRALQCASFRLEEPPAIRCADSGELFARFCIEQLAQRRAATSLARVCVWGALRHALACFRRGDGHRAGPIERPTHDGDAHWKRAIENSYCKSAWY